MEVGDFVVAVKDFDGIVRRSVGMVMHADGDLDVLFIGLNRRVTLPPEYVEWLDITKTGKPKSGPHHSKKICNRCFLLKDNITEFQRNQNDAQGRFTTRPSCNDCRVIIDGKKLSTKERRRMDSFKPSHHSIYTCPICEKRMIVGMTAKIIADHDHNTGKGRKWICDSCNTGLGRFGDDIMSLERVIAYLKQFV